jgi:hypothetical protein
LRRRRITRYVRNVAILSVIHITSSEGLHRKRPSGNEYCVLRPRTVSPQACEAAGLRSA